MLPAACVVTLRCMRCQPSMVQAINKSLSALGDVIASLQSKSGHVPYRNSKLTQVRQGAGEGISRAWLEVIVPGSRCSWALPTPHPAMVSNLCCTALTPGWHNITTGATHPTTRPPMHPHAPLLLLPCRSCKTACAAPPRSCWCAASPPRPPAPRRACPPSTLPRAPRRCGVGTWGWLDSWLAVV